jgi:hypothetical protein
MIRDCILVFLAVLAMDFVWALYAKAIQRHAVIAASSWAGAIIVFSGLSQIAYVNDPILLIPAVLGAVVGTAAAMKWSHRIA